MNKSLVGLRVWVSISDPWEFVTDNGESRTGTVVGEDAGVVESRHTLRIRLDAAVKASGVASNAVFARFRRVTGATQQLLSGQLVPCNFSTELSESELSASNCAVAFIGGLRLLT